MRPPEPRSGCADGTDPPSAASSGEPTEPAQPTEPTEPSEPTQPTGGGAVVVPIRAPAADSVGYVSSQDAAPIPNSLDVFLF